MHRYEHSRPRLFARDCGQYLVQGDGQIRQGKRLLQHDIAWVEFAIVDNRILGISGHVDDGRIRIVDAQGICGLFAAHISRKDDICEDQVWNWDLPHTRKGLVTTHRGLNDASQRPQLRAVERQ